MDNGTLRWRRLEDLLDQSSRSLDYDPSQLWLIAGELKVEGRVCGGMPLSGHAAERQITSTASAGPHAVLPWCG